MPSRGGSVGSVAACSCECSDLCGCTLGISTWVGVSLASPGLVHFWPKKRKFWTETRFCSLEAQRLDDKTGHTRRPRWTSDQLFPSLARPDLALPRPQLAEIGPSLHPVVGRRRHVRESISLSSPTGPPDTQTDPPDPQTGLPSSFGKMYFF